MKLYFNKSLLNCKGSLPSNSCYMCDRDPSYQYNVRNCGVFTLGLIFPNEFVCEGWRPKEY